MRQDDHLSALHPGAKLHIYTIGTILGAGGFGITYKAREDITEREVAIKEYLPTAFAVRDRDGSTVRPISQGVAADFGWGLERFRQEAKLLIDFRHPNIVPVLAYFEANGTGYLVMEFQDGTSLGEVLRTHRTLPQSEMLNLIVPLLDGVEEVHRHDFLHRDIKPENIFVRSDKIPVLLDFGAARQALGEHSKSLTTLLTEGYSPFEQYAGTGHQGPWSDIYALAAVMFRCLTGKPPIEAPRRAIAKLRGQADPMAPDFAALRGLVSSDLAFAIEAGMRVVEHERPQTVAAFRELILAPGPATIRIPARTPVETPLPARSPATTSPAIAPSAATLIPDMAHRISGLHRPHRREAERPRPKRIARNAGFAAVLVAAAGAAAYVSDHRSWLPEAFRQAGSDAAPPSPGLQPAAATEDPRRKQEADRRAQDERIKAEDERRADELRRQNDDELRRIAEERRRAQEKPGEEEERRAKALAEYQKKQIEQSEAERRPSDPAKTQGPERKRADDGAAPESGPNQPPNSDRSTTEPPRTMPEPRGNFEPYESPDSRRAGTNPGAPPSLRRPNAPGPQPGYYPPELPGSRGRGTGWRPPGYSDDY